MSFYFLQPANFFIEKSTQYAVFYLTQLIGLALGVKKEKLGLEFNLSPVDKLKID